MTRYFKETFALSDKGAKDMVSAIAAVVMQNMALMAPVSLLYLFTGDCLQGIRLFTRTGMYVGGIGICLALIAAASIWQYDTTYRATYTESATRRISLAEKLRKLPLSFFAKKDLADLTSTIMSDAEAMEHAGSHMIPQFYGSMISTMILSIGLCFFQWRMALAAVWPIPISLFIVLTSKRVQNHFSRTQQQAKIDLADHVQEYIETLRDLKCNNAEHAYLDELETEIDLVERRSIGNELGTAIFVVSAQLLLRFGIATVALAGGAMLTGGTLTLMQFFCFLLVASRLYDPMGETLVNLAAINALQINVDRIQAINHSTEQGGTTAFSPKGYTIVFDHVGFSYGEEEHHALSDVSFTAGQGKVTALVGPSGGGKTTVGRLAARFWVADTGSITIGGVDIRTIDPETLLGAFSIVFQDVTLFNNTVRENIRIGKKDATDKEVEEAARLAGCDTFVQRLPDGYDTVIGENGCKLSGGERQRISIARAFLKDAPIILLDEATASLDVENETEVQSALSRLIKKKTVIVIAHRMRTIAKADTIVVLSDGHVAEQGTPEELMARQGLFADMVRLQTEGQNWSLANHEKME